MTDTEYIRALASALTRQEDLLDAEARDILYEFALRIYALLLRDFPTSRFDRYRLWPQFRARILVWLQELNDALAPLVLSRVTLSEALLQKIHADLFAAPLLPPRPTPQVLSSTRVMGTPLSELFVPGPTGLTPFSLQLLRLVERSVFGMIFQEAPTAEVARRIIEVRTRAGREVPVPRKGTVANAWRERLRAITAAALWALVSPTAQRYAAEADVAELRWRWNAVLDPRTCPICRPLHNTTAPAPEAFPKGPPPLHPLCVLGDTKVVTGQIIAATRAFYFGNIVTVRTESGGQFSVTSQHPMLTSVGWVRADQLTNSHHLLRHSDGMPSGFDLPDLNNSPATAEQVFKSFRASGKVSSAGVPASTMQFHGDGAAIKGDVEVVWADWVFQFAGSTEDIKDLSEFQSIFANSELPFVPSFGYTDLLFLGYNATASGLMSFGQECFSLLGSKPSLSEQHGLASIALSNTKLIEPFYDYVSGAAEKLGKALDASAGLVKPDQVIDIKVQSSGHAVPVYDFTTLGGLYSLDRLLGHNCRCILVPAAT